MAQPFSHRLHLKHLIKILGLAALIASGTLVFQNCSPVGESVTAGSMYAPTAADLQANPALCDSLPRPSLSYSGATSGHIVQSGQGNDSGNVSIRFSGFSFTKGFDGWAIASQVQDTGPINSTFNVNNSGNQSQVTVAPDGQCSSGAATMTVFLRGTYTPLNSTVQCTGESNKISIPITVRDNCLPVVGVVASSPQELRREFGARVSMDGNYAVAAAPGDSQAGSNAGAAYVYVKSGSQWTFMQKLVPSSLQANDVLNQVAVSGNIIVGASAYHKADGLSQDGAVFIYRLQGGTWIETQKITLPVEDKNTTSGLDLFGYAIDISGASLVVGAPGLNHGDATNLTQAGKAFVYQDSGSQFTLTRTLVASDKKARDYFGASVAVSGNNVVIGAPSSQDADKSTYTGKAYLFQGAMESKLIPNLTGNRGVSAGRNYGASVDIVGDRIAIGSPGDGVGNGIAYTTQVSSLSNWRSYGGNDGAPLSGQAFGQSVALAANGLVVGAPLAQTRAGRARYYGFDGALKWVIFPRNGSIGEADQFGESVAQSGGWVFGGSRGRDQEGVRDAGAGFIFQLLN